MSEPFGIVASVLTAAAEQVAGVDVLLLAIALLGQLGYSVLRATAWRNVLRAAYPQERVCLLDVAAANSSAAAISAVTVGQAGSCVKAGVMRGRLDSSTLTAIAATLGVIAVFDTLFGAGSLVVAWRLGAVHALPAPSAVPTAALLAIPVLLAAVAVAAVLLRDRAARIAHALREAVARGTTVLRQPAGYLRCVASVQLLAWAARVGVVFFFLHAFAIPASLVDALIVVVMMGLASAIPSGPGGAGAQQVAIVVALHGTAPAAAAVSFGIGMQLVMTAFNVTLGVAACTYLFGTLRPHLIVRHGRALLAAGRAG